jgi:hypothetical protein
MAGMATINMAMATMVTITMATMMVTTTPTPNTTPTTTATSSGNGVNIGHSNSCSNLPTSPARTLPLRRGWCSGVTATAREDHQEAGQS